MSNTKRFIIVYGFVHSSCKCLFKKRKRRAKITIYLVPSLVVGVDERCDCFVLHIFACNKAMKRKKGCTLSTTYYDDFTIK